MLYDLSHLQCWVEEVAPDAKWGLLQYLRGEQAPQDILCMAVGDLEEVHVCAWGRLEYCIGQTPVFYAHFEGKASFLAAWEQLKGHLRGRCSRIQWLLDEEAM